MKRLTLKEAYETAKKYNKSIMHSNTPHQLAYKVKKKNYNGYHIEAIPLINLYTLDSLRLTTDFRSGFQNSYMKKYTKKGYKKWARI